MQRPSVHLIRCLLALALLLPAGACEIGNTSGVCSAGDTCECDILGNCDYSCPGGGCHFLCKGTGNCLFTCEGGGCDLLCENTGNCILTCPGTDCEITCNSTGNCILRPCEGGCEPDGGVDSALLPDAGVPDLPLPDLETLGDQAVGDLSDLGAGDLPDLAPADQQAPDLIAPDTVPPPGQHDWSKSFGDNSSDIGSAVAIDGSGNIYVAGYFNGAVNLGGGLLVSAGNEDIFLASYTTGGAHRFSQRFGGAGLSDVAHAVAVDPSGNSYITGQYDSPTNFGGGVLTPDGYDLYLASFDPSGAHRFSQRFGGSYIDTGNGAAVGPSGEVCLTGSMYYTVDFGGGPLTATNSVDAFVACYSSSGAHLWSKVLGGVSGDRGYGVAVGPNGTVYVTGGFQGSVDFGGGPLTSAGSWDFYLAAYSAAGAHLWSKGFGGPFYDLPRAVTVDQNGNVTLLGAAAGPLDLGGGPLTSAGSTDLVVAQFSSTGAHLWSRVEGGTGPEAGYGLAVDSSGTVFATGIFEGTATLGGEPLTSAGGSDIFVAAYSSAGQPLWGKGYGSTGDDYGMGLAVDSGGVLVTGSFRGSVDFGGGPLTSAGDSDIFVLRLLQ